MSAEIATSARLEWQVATVKRVVDETARARTLFLDVPRWPGHRAGQHVDVRLVAEDGYQAQRSYSIASAPEDSLLSLTVERLEDGEVSPYLCGALREGDGLELRNMFARTAQPGLWFIAGSLAQCRIYSKYLALQTKASEAGLLPPTPRPGGRA